jgi:hypothetical protein
MDKDSCMPAGGTRVFHVVFNVTLERGYPGDGLSLDRESTDFTVHPTREAALARLLAELDANLAADAVAALRRSFAVAASVPAGMLADGSPHRWISDRAGVLLARAGADPRAHVHAAARGKLADALHNELVRALTDLNGVLLVPDPPPDLTAALAMDAAGAAARAERHAAILPALAATVTAACQQAGAAAWAGDDARRFGAGVAAAIRAVAGIDVASGRSAGLLPADR